MAALGIGFLFLLLALLGVRWWQGRRDVWIAMNNAPFFVRGEVIIIGNTATRKRARVVKITRSALKVRPL